MKILTFILMAFLLVGCNNQEEEKEPKIRIFDPRIPNGTTAENPLVKDITSLKAVTTYNSVELKWVNPSIYTESDFEIHIFRIDGDEEVRNLPDPSVAGSPAFLYYPRSDFEPFKGSIYKDENGTLLNSLIEGRTYSYYVYVKKDNRYSSGKKITVEIPTKEATVTIPNPVDFWKNYTQKQGGRPDPDYHMITLSTLEAGTPTISMAKGGMAYAKNGTVLLIADTDTNRVMIYVNTLAQECFKSPEGSFERQICLTMYGNAPLTAYSVLGQSSFTASYPCGDINNTLTTAQCMTGPTQVFVDDKDRVYISDNLNNRILVWDTFPLNGCYNIKNLTGETTPVQCTPSRVIGQRRLNEIVHYDINTDGDVALSCPNGMAMRNNNLYIADTCNNRVVVARNAGDPALFNCNDSNWKTSRCSFGGVLFQEDLYSNDSFQKQWNDGNFTYDLANNALIGDLTYLARHMANPKLVKFYEGKMYVSGNENFNESNAFGALTLYGRLLRYNSDVLEGTFPICNPTSFFSGGCDADWVYGQQGFDIVPITPFGGNYTDFFHTIGDIGGFDFFDKRMFLTDPTSNIVSIWFDHLSDSQLGSPASQRVFNPNGAWDADRDRSQPNLKGIGTVIFREDKNGLTIFDSGDHYFYSVRLINPW